MDGSAPTTGPGPRNVLGDLASVTRALSAAQARVLVAVDGPDAAGKTMLADALAHRLPGPVVRASVDGFHNPAGIRLRRGSLSPQGYYRDSFDYGALAAGLLGPFTSGAAAVTTAVYDYRREAATPTVLSVEPESVLIVDGVFLLRRQLRHWWTLSVYLHVPPEVTLRRALARDQVLFRSRRETGRRYRLRYLPAQRMYRAEAGPADKADVVLDNCDPGSPLVLKWDITRRRNTGSASRHSHQTKGAP